MRLRTPAERGCSRPTTNCRGRGRRQGWVGGVLGGWQLNAVANWQTGVPFGVTNSTALANTGGTDRPNLIGDPELPKSERTPQRWFNTAAFQAQPAFTVGNSPPTVLHGPSQRRLDFALFKELKLHASATLQLRYEGVQRHEHAELPEPDQTRSGARTSDRLRPRALRFRGRCSSRRSYCSSDPPRSKPTGLV